LKQRGIAFEFHICGDGSQADFIRQEVQRYGLEGDVVLHGALDFKAELLPLIRNEVDLFVCCHRQGDPSCTYLETMACGVPIVGFLNEAFEGLLELGDFGHGVPIDDVRALADLIVELDHSRNRIAELSRNALAFSREHSFERTFARRIEHMRRIRVAR
ncbi:MAG: glycosyltransferase, partial [Pseudomonadales bacterium]|nr:glycosyltransferase [Pseudomonadales bacterium]